MLEGRSLKPHHNIHNIPSGDLLPIAIENGPVEIVDFPIFSRMVDLSSSLC